MIMNTDRARKIANQWRYLVLPLALIAVAGFLLIPRYSTKNSFSNSPVNASLKPAEGKPVKTSYSREEQELIDLIQQVAEVIPHQWHYRYFKAGLPDERLLFSDIRLYNKRSALTIVPPRPPNFSGSIILNKVEVRDFEVVVNGDSAAIDFIGSIHLSIPGQDREEIVTDPYRVKLVRVKSRWQADRRNRPLSVNAMFWPPEAPTMAYPVLQGAWAEAQKATSGVKIINLGDAEFSVQSSPASYDSQNVEALIDDLERRTCRCSAQAVQNAAMKLGELEVRGEKGIRFSHAEKGVQMKDQDGLRIFAIDAIHFKDRFELQWGERTYYGLGSATAKYHQDEKRLSIGSFPETRLYRTPERTGEAVTLRRLAQELKDQSLRKN